IEAEAPGRPTWYVHGAMNGRVHAMRGAAMAAAAGNPNIRVRTFYAAPEAEDRCGQDYDEAGRITAAWLVANTPHAEAT
ncbi:MAG: globin, partial [Methylobacterium brachiatum]|nr:globin [Methylobacterium brachiatum]